MYTLGQQYVRGGTMTDTNYAAGVAILQKLQPHVEFSNSRKVTALDLDVHSGVLTRRNKRLKIPYLSAIAHDRPQLRQ